MNIINLVKSGIDLFRTGQSLKNSAAWKAGTINVNLFATFMAALAAVLVQAGFSIPNITPDQYTALSSGVVLGFAAIYSIFNVIMHIITSDKVGFLPPKA